MVGPLLYRHVVRKVVFVENGLCRVDIRKAVSP